MTTKEKNIFPKGTINREELARFKIIFDALENDPLAYDFLMPVDYIRIYILFINYSSRP